MGSDYDQGKCKPSKPIADCVVIVLPKMGLLDMLDVNEDYCDNGIGLRSVC